MKEDIIKASNSIRRKYKLLKRGLAEEEETTKKQFEPLLKPLETLIDLSGHEDEKKPEPNLLPKPTKKITARPPKTKRVVKSRKKTEANPAVGPSVERDDLPEYQEDVFESGGSDSVLERKWHEYLSQFGPLTKKYLDGCLRDKGNHYDDKYGIRADDRTKTWVMGRKEVQFDKQDNIHIEDKMFTGTTRGLYELLFKRLPDEKLYSQKDLSKYKEMLIWTDAHLLTTKRGSKYKKIIEPLFKKEGGKLLPVTNNKIDYVHWNDPNELVSRLALLLASREAGNHGLETEIAAIEEELREEGYIQ